ncbi:YraN family protein [uncultured Rikenella sp.]|uniref:YraN family protein n=1 Tax=uncultured Rikenella sp. TaxID=368003 RepID=UPI00260DD05E|nr:YraN family protein [uncultured Rikenella sp.]
MATHIDTGQWGEETAAEYLCACGWKIVERRWRDTAARGMRTDIDIIAISPDGVYHFVEVKTRTGRSSVQEDFSPEAAVTPAKARRMAQAAERYMAHRNLTAETAVDLVAVRTVDGTGTPEIRYYSDLVR